MAYAKTHWKRFKGFRGLYFWVTAWYHGKRQKITENRYFESKIHRMKWFAIKKNVLGLSSGLKATVSAYVELLSNRSKKKPTIHPPKNEWRLLLHENSAFWAKKPKYGGNTFFGFEAQNHKIFTQKFKLFRSKIRSFT